MSINANVKRAESDYNRAYEAGRQEKNCSLMTAFQQGGERVSYVDAFSTQYWTDEVFRPIFNMNVTSGIRMFKQCSITDLKGILERQGVVLDTSACGNLYEFMSGSTITRTPAIDASLCPTLTQTFYNCLYLVSIEKLIVSADGSTTFDNTFYNCKELVHLVIEGVVGGKGIHLKWSVKLDKVSITSVINALSTTTTGLTVTFSKTAVDTAFATTEGGADGSTSAEWLALVATRSNWTIALA